MVEQRFPQLRKHIFFLVQLETSGKRLGFHVLLSTNARTGKLSSTKLNHLG